MKRLILGVILLASLVGFGLAEDEYVSYQTYDTDAFKIYYVAAGTETAARYNVTTGSISLIVAGGFNPGTKAFTLTSADISTFALFKASMTALANTANTSGPAASGAALQGAWMVEFPEDVSPSTLMTSLAEVIISSNCFGLANKKQLVVDTSSTTIISLLPTARPGRVIKVKYAISQVTGTAPTICIYNQSGTALTPSVSMTSGSPIYFGVEDTNHPLAISVSGETVSIRVVTQAAMSAGYLLVGYTVE